MDQRHGQQVGPGDSEGYGYTSMLALPMLGIPPAPPTVVPESPGRWDSQH